MSVGLQVMELPGERILIAKLICYLGRVDGSQKVPNARKGDS